VWEYPPLAVALSLGRIDAGDVLGINATYVQRVRPSSTETRGRLILGLSAVSEARLAPLYYSQRRGGPWCRE
jgi:hypothetical protein